MKLTPLQYRRDVVFIHYHEHRHRYRPTRLLAQPSLGIECTREKGERELQRDFDNNDPLLDLITRLEHRALNKCCAENTVG